MKYATVILAAASVMMSDCTDRTTKIITRVDMPAALTIDSLSVEEYGLADYTTVEKVPEVVFETDAAIRSALVAHDGKLFFGDADRNFYALDTATGEVLWRYNITDHTVETLPVVTDGRVVFNASNALYILDAGTGAQIAKTLYRTDDATRVSDDLWAFNDSGVAIASGIAYFAPLNGDIVGVRIADGTVVNTFPAVVPGEVASGVSLSEEGGLLYWVDRAGSLCALDPKNGRLVFRTELEDRVFAPMLISGGRIYLGGRSCRVYCVDAAEGDVIWSSCSLDPTTWFSGGTPGNPPTLWTCTSDEHTLLGLDAGTGEFRRMLSTTTNAYTRPALHGGNVIVAATDVYALDRTDIMEYDTRRNTMLWRATMPDAVLSSPVVTEDRLWVASESGKIYRFGLD